MNKINSQKYIYEYENKLEFLEATKSIADLIDPSILALPDARETIAEFASYSSLRNFEDICIYFQSTFNDMKEKNIGSYSNALDLLYHRVGRFFLRENELPEDIKKTAEISNVSKPISQLSPQSYANVIATQITVSPSGFQIIAKHREETIFLNSNLDKRTLSLNSVIAPLDHPSLPIDFRTVSYEVKPGGEITKQVSDSREKTR